VNLRTIAFVAFAVCLVAYLYLIFFLTITPASILYSKPPEPQAPFTTYLLMMWQHEVAMVLTGGAVVAYSISLFRVRRDWRPFAVLLIGVPFAVGIFEVFGL
jgi:hypothetical protein